MSELVPTSAGSPPPAADVTPPSVRGVLCVKCESLNDLGAELCRRCQAHLHVFCQRCGAKNARVNSRCENCRRRLHRGVSKHLRGKDGDVNLLVIGLAVVAVLVVLAVLVWASGFRG